MRVIFLDVDGVLNCMYTKEREPNGCIGIADAPLAALADIVRMTGAELVLVSTWKKDWSIERGACKPLGEYLNEKLESVGLRIRDCTEDNMFNRGRGIRKWLSHHPEVESWIVLDDEVFDDYWLEEILPHHVETNFIDGGLKADMIQLCVDMLNEKENEDGNSD